MLRGKSSSNSMFYFSGWPLVIGRWSSKVLQALSDFLWSTNHTVLKWLVVNIFYFSIYWECHHPNWLIFFRGVGQPPTRYSNEIELLIHGFSWNGFSISCHGQCPMSCDASPRISFVGESPPWCVVQSPNVWCHPTSSLLFIQHVGQKLPWRYKLFTCFSTFLDFWR